MATILKQRTEKYTQSVDFVNRLPSGTSLSSGAATVLDLTDSIDVSSTFLTSTTCAISTTKLQVTFAADQGVIGHDYRVEIVATLNNANKLEEDFFVRVRD